MAQRSMYIKAFRWQGLVAFHSCWSVSSPRCRSRYYVVPISFMLAYHASKERSVTMQHCALMKRHLNGGYIGRRRAWRQVRLRLSACNLTHRSIKQLFRLAGDREETSVALRDSLVIRLYLSIVIRMPGPVKSLASYELFAYQSNSSITTPPRTMGPRPTFEFRGTYDGSEPAVRWLKRLEWELKGSGRDDIPPEQYLSFVDLLLRGEAAADWAETSLEISTILAATTISLSINQSIKQSVS